MAGGLRRQSVIQLVKIGPSDGCGGEIPWRRWEEEASRVGEEREYFAKKLWRLLKIERAGEILGLNF